MFQLPKCPSLAIVGISKFGVKLDSLLIGHQGLLVTIEIVQSIALSIVGRGTRGVQAYGLLIGNESFLKTFELPERPTLAIIGRDVAGIKLNCSFVSLQRFLVMGMVIELIALIQPLFFALLHRGHV